MFIWFICHLYDTWIIYNVMEMNVFEYCISKHIFDLAWMMCNIKWMNVFECCISTHIFNLTWINITLHKWMFYLIHLSFIWYIFLPFILYLNDVWPIRHDNTQCFLLMYFILNHILYFNWIHIFIMTCDSNIC